MENQGRLFKIEQFFDDNKFSRRQLLVVVLCALIATIDGFDAQLMGFVAPSLIQALHVSRAVLGPVFSAGLVGMMVGSLACGPLADKIGRKPVLILCMLWVAVWSLATVGATTVNALLVLRFLTGLGLGGAMPNATAMTSEYAPSRLRATCVVLMYSGFSIGAALGGSVVSALLEHFEWQAVFVFGGVLPIILVAILLFALPESIRFMVVKGWPRDKIYAALRKIQPSLSVDDKVIFTAAEKTVGAQPVKQLFMEGRAPVTLLIWLMFAMGYLDLYFLNSWLPTIIHDDGASIHDAVMITALFQLGGTCGTLLLGRLIDRYTPSMVLSLAFLIGTFCVFMIGSAGTSLALLAFTVFCAGSCIVGGLIGLTAVTAAMYPTAIRSTGIGWAIGTGRIGGVVGPLLGGALLSLGWSSTHVFEFAAGPALLTAVAALAITMIGRRRRLVPSTAQ